MTDSVLVDVLVLLAATLVVVASLRRLRLPPVLGFLVVGAALGPHALGWVEDTETTSTLAEFGIVFLLFTLGLEFSLPRMIAMRNEVFALGSAQVGLTAAAFGAIAWWLGRRGRRCWAGPSPCPPPRLSSSSSPSRAS
jgi:CPA2 family monovalent cation:H+ antiporter-2